MFKVLGSFLSSNPAERYSVPTPYAKTASDFENSSQELKACPRLIRKPFLPQNSCSFQLDFFKIIPICFKLQINP